MTVSDAAVTIDIHEKSFGVDAVLGAIRFSIAPGESVALTGPSGIGKSTLLRIVCGLDDDYKGTVEKPDRFSVVFQEPTLLPWRTALQNLTLVTGIDGIAAESALAEVGLAGKGGFYPSQLSLGQQRRLALARAFAVKPDFLVMDEPFASLDDDKAAEMIALTRSLVAAHGVTTLFVTHSAREAEALADRVLRLEGHPARLSNSQ